VHELYKTYNNYLKNPVVLFGHAWYDLPIGKCISIELAKSGLKATVEFVSKEISPVAETVYQMCKNGFLNATSVGFRAIKSVYDSDRHGYDIEEAELYEFSIVPIPANPNALIAAGEKGIDTTMFKDFAKEQVEINSKMLESYFTMKNNELQVEKLNAVVAEKDEEIKVLNELLDEKAVEIKALDELIAEKGTNKEVEQLKNEINELEKELKSYRLESMKKELIKSIREGN